MMRCSRGLCSTIPLRKMRCSKIESEDLPSSSRERKSLPIWRPRKPKNCLSRAKGTWRNSRREWESGRKSRCKKISCEFETWVSSNLFYSTAQVGRHKSSHKTMQVQSSPPNPVQSSNNVFFCRNLCSTWGKKSKWATKSGSSRSEVICKKSKVGSRRQRRYVSK
jgi:hypothetical protein